jgi:CheY-like chemotaxis protein
MVWEIQIGDVEMCHALVIEDDYLAADYIAALAEMAGATSTEIAQTEAEAIAAARRARPDVMLCDVRLADGCGQTAAFKIRAELGEISTLYVTGDPEACRSAPYAKAVLPKPFERDAFIAAFREHASISDAA